MSTEKRPPTADEIAKLIKQSWNSAGSQYPIVEKLRDALEAQADQLKQARAFLQALSSGMYEPEIWMEIKVWLAANPAPTTEVPRCPQCGEAATYRLPDGQWFDGNAHAWRTPATESEHGND